MRSHQQAATGQHLQQPQKQHQQQSQQFRLPRPTAQQMPTTTSATSATGVAAATPTAHNSNNAEKRQETVEVKANVAPTATAQAATPTALKSLNGTGGAGNHHNINMNSNHNHKQQRKQFTLSASTANIDGGVGGDAGSNASFSSASVSGSVQDDMNGGVPCGGLTQAGLEEYNIRAAATSCYYDQPVLLYHHQKQSSYAQSEGYHSYVSSSDSSSATPFLDRLRQESDMLSRQSSHWSQNCDDLSSLSCTSLSVTPSPTPAGAPTLLPHNNVLAVNDTLSMPVTLQASTANQQLQPQQHAHQHNNSSESTSSTETLKWLGSMSDVSSEASHATGYSTISETVATAASQLIVHSSRVLSPQRHQSESVLFLNNEEQPALSPSPTQPVATATALAHSSPRPLQPQHRYSPSYPPLHSTTALYSFEATAPRTPHSPSAEDLSTSSLASPGGQKTAAEPLQQHTSSISLMLATTEPTLPTATPTNAEPDGACSYRSNHRLFPVSTYTEPVHSNTSQYVQHPKPQYSTGLQKPQGAAAPTNGPMKPAVIAAAAQASLPTPTSIPNWHSVAERINDFERSGNADGLRPPTQQQPQKYAYIEPSKTHRISNPALKAFQKNAVQSYFERQQQQQQHAKEPQQKSYLLRQQQHAVASQQDAPPLRHSLPNTYAALTPPPQHQQTPPTHYRGTRPHSNDVGDGLYAGQVLSSVPPPPPPRSRSLMPALLRRSSSASDYAEFRDQYRRATQETLAAQSIKNITSAEKLSFNDCGMPPPPPPPRGRASQPLARRTSSASEYAAMRDKMLQQSLALSARGNSVSHQHQHQRQQQPHYYYASPPPPSEGWAPERPPKNPNMRVPSPELPPPPLTPVDTSLSDEPLPPPPPPEILHRHAAAVVPAVDGTYYDASSAGTTPSPPNRRNSFAGSSTSKAIQLTAKGHAAHQAPPQVPKKPSNIAARTTMESMLQKPHSMLVNCLSTTYGIGSPNRKRSHMPAPPTSVPPIMEYQPPQPTSSSMPKTTGKTSPPPLMPRMSSSSATNNSIAAHAAISTKMRCNSKASYLPRQSLEKLNSAGDPDHGSYKLTLDSHEDLVGVNAAPLKPTYDILATVAPATKPAPSNLPDVLPLGAKLQQQSSSPNGSICSENTLSAHYSSNPNDGAGYGGSYVSQLPQHRYSTPALGERPVGSATPNNQQHYTRSQSYDACNGAGGSHAKHKSQSTIDLKRADYSLLDTTLSEETPQALSSVNAHGIGSAAPSLVSPALSESNLRHVSGNPAIASAPDGKIFRAELVNTTLANSPAAGGHKQITRKDSLRENIEKITQLQSKLMSAHFADNGSGMLLSGYTKQTSPAPAASSKPARESKVTCSIAPHQGTIPTKTIVTVSTETGNVEQTERAGESEPTPITQMDTSTDGLKLMQRSELVLHVNPSTAEVASQTDEIAEDDDLELNGRLYHSREETPTRSTLTTTLQPRQRYPIEIECDNLSRELAALLPSDDRLLDVLALTLPPPGAAKCVADYVGSIYNTNMPLRRCKRRDIGTSTLTREQQRPTTPTTTPPPLNMVELELSLVNGGGLEYEPNCDHLAKRKVDELIKQLQCKLKLLSREQSTIGEDAFANDALGGSLVHRLADKVRPLEASKCRTYIDDVGHITSLLLSLSERLARVENSLSGAGSADISGNAENKLLATKRDLLLEQLDEAKRLKADIDRRGKSVYGVLAKYLSADEFADFDYFINMKAKLIADARDIADKLKSGEEQIKALSEVLMQSDC